jgi:hypothetical protein
MAEITWTDYQSSKQLEGLNTSLGCIRYIMKRARKWKNDFMDETRAPPIQNKGGTTHGKEKRKQ